MRRLFLAGAAALGLLLGAVPAGADNIPWANAAPKQCAALCASLATNPPNGPHTLFTWGVNADATLSGSTWYVLIYNAASKPGDGAVTPTKCFTLPSGQLYAGSTLTGTGEGYPLGVVIVVSTTGCFTQTSSTHAMIQMDWQ